MKQSLFLFLLISLLLSFYGCDKCRNALNEREALGIWLNFENENTQQNLFFGDGKIYDESDFELFYKSSGDTLVRVSPYNLHFDKGIIFTSTKTFSEKIISSFYYKLESTQPLDTIDIHYNEIEDECLGTFKESYDVRLNGEVICDDCSHRDIITIYK